MQANRLYRYIKRKNENNNECRNALALANAVSVCAGIMFVT